MGSRSFHPGLANPQGSAQVQWRRFFTFCWAFEELDRSWTARLVAGRFVCPSMSDLLSRAAAAPHTEEDQQLQARALADNPPKLADGQAGAAAVRERRAKQGRMLDFATSVLGNRNFQCLGRSIVAAIDPLRCEYLRTIEVFGRGNVEIVRWHASRAAGDWKAMAAEMLRTLADRSAIERCCLSAFRATADEPAPRTLECRSVDELLQRADALVDMVVNAAGIRLWGGGLVPCTHVMSRGARVVVGRVVSERWLDGPHSSDRIRALELPFHRLLPATGYFNSALFCNVSHWVGRLPMPRHLDWGLVGRPRPLHVVPLAVFGVLARPRGVDLAPRGRSLSGRPARARARRPGRNSGWRRRILCPRKTTTCVSDKSSCACLIVLGRGGRRTREHMARAPACGTNASCLTLRCCIPSFAAFCGVLVFCGSDCTLGRSPSKSEYMNEQGQQAISAALAGKGFINHGPVASKQINISAA